MTGTEEERKAWQELALKKIEELGNRMMDLSYDSPLLSYLKGRQNRGWAEFYAADYEKSFEWVKGEWMQEPEQPEGPERSLESSFLELMGA